MQHWIWKSYNRVTRPTEEQRVVSSKHHLARFQIAESITFAYNSQKNHPGASYTSNGENEIRNYFLLLIRTVNWPRLYRVSKITCGSFTEFLRNNNLCFHSNSCFAKKIHKSDWKFILNQACPKRFFVYFDSQTKFRRE